MAKLPSADPQRDWPELIAFIGVLAAGTSLIIFGHMSAAGLSTVCAAMVGLFTALRLPDPPEQRSTSTASTPGRPGHQPGRRSAF